MVNFFRQGDRSNLAKALVKTRSSIFGQIGTLFRSTELNNTLFEELEDILVASDLGFETSQEVICKLEGLFRSGEIESGGDAISSLKKILSQILSIKAFDWSADSAEPPLAVLMVGVNGSGKTTTIAKLSKWYQDMGKTVIAGAGDTFRAAAAEQLEIWGKTLSIDVITHQIGSDPGAVVFDTINAAKSRGVDVALIDTAGRLQNKRNLMVELQKIHRICARESSPGSSRVMLTIDSTTGQNGLTQAKSFNQFVPCNGVFLSKLDGSAKGGIALPIVKNLDIPISFVGTGESVDDLAIFDPNSFVDSLFTN